MSSSKTNVNMVASSTKFDPLPSDPADWTAWYKICVIAEAQKQGFQDFLLGDPLDSSKPPQRPVTVRILRPKAKAALIAKQKEHDRLQNAAWAFLTSIAKNTPMMSLLIPFSVRGHPSPSFSAWNALVNDYENGNNEDQQSILLKRLHACKSDPLVLTISRLIFTA